MEVETTMQCYQYLAIQRYARRHLREWAEELDDLELAEELDRRNVQTLSDIKGLGS